MCRGCCPGRVALHRDAAPGRTDRRVRGRERHCQPGRGGQRPTPATRAPASSTTDNVVGSYIQWTVTAARRHRQPDPLRQRHDHRPADGHLRQRHGRRGRVGLQQHRPTGTPGPTRPSPRRSTPAATPSGSPRPARPGRHNLDYLDFEVTTTPPPTVSRPRTPRSRRASWRATTPASPAPASSTTTTSRAATSSGRVTPSAAGSAGLTIRYANGTTANRPMAITVNGTTSARPPSPPPAPGPPGPRSRPR